jgi:hypothetical protein
MAGYKISELSALGAGFATTDLFEVSDDGGGAGYTSKSITGSNLAVGVYSVIGGWDSGNSRLGIGTASPSVTLDVIGIISSALAPTSLSQGYLQLGVDSGGDPGGEIMFHTDDYIGIRCANSGALPFVVKPSGNVGIGTTAPAVALDVIGIGSFALAESSLSQGVVQVGVDSGGDPGGELLFHTDDYVGIRCANSGVAPFVVKPSGNVGIGTNAPKTALSTVYDYDTTTFENQLSDNEGGGEILRYGSGQAGAIGTLHFLQTDGSWDATDSNAVGTGGSQLLGIAMGTDPGTDGMLLKGYYRVAAASIEGTGVIGAPAYISEVAGKIDFTAPSGSGDFVRILGYCIDYHSDGDGSILIYFDPDKTWILLS